MSEFACVSVYRKDTGEMNVVRRCYFTSLDEEPKQNMRQKLTFLANLGTHDNILPLEAFDIGSARCITVMPYLSGWMSLDTYIKTTSLGETEVTRVITQVMSGLQFLHRKQAYHGNVCLQNILFDPINLNARLTDYG